MVSSTYVPDVKRSITSFYRFLVQRYNEKLDCPTFFAIIPDLRSTSAGNDIFYSENIFRFLGEIENKIALDLKKSRAVSGL